MLKTKKKKDKPSMISRKSINCFMEAARFSANSAKESEASLIKREEVNSVEAIRLLVESTIFIAQLYKQAAWNLAAANSFLDEVYIDELIQINQNRDLIVDYTISALMQYYASVSVQLSFKDTLNTEKNIHSTLYAMLKTASAVAQFKSNKTHISNTDLHPQALHQVELVEKLLEDTLNLMNSKVLKCEHCKEFAFDFISYLENLRKLKANL
jgi:hypothetical protein